MIILQVNIRFLCCHAMPITNLTSASRMSQQILYALLILSTIPRAIICEYAIPRACGDYKHLGALIVEIQIS